jgi:hypothetical protein
MVVLLTGGGSTLRSIDQEDHQMAPQGRLKTVGISPKVWIPAVAQVVAGAGLIIAGLDVEGKTAIATGVGTFLTGFGARPAPTEVR